MSYRVLLHTPTLLVFYTFNAATLTRSFYNVYQARKSRGQPFLSTLLQLAPIIVFFAANYAWLLSPYSNILKNGGLMRVGLTMTFVFGRMTTKIILVIPYL